MRLFRRVEARSRCIVSFLAPADGALAYVRCTDDFAGEPVNDGVLDRKSVRKASKSDVGSRY